MNNNILQGSRNITVIYDENRYRFNTSKIDSLAADDTYKIKIKELFDVFSKNRTYVRLLDSTTPKAGIIIILTSLLLGIIFLSIAIKSSGNHRYEYEPKIMTDKSNQIDTFYDKQDKFVSSKDVNKKVDPQLENNDEDDKPKVGDPQDMDFTLGIVAAGYSNKWKREKNAVYWVMFSFCVIAFVFTLIILIGHQVRQRRLYQALEKYELDTLGDYMAELQDNFYIRRLHKKKAIFKYLKCFYCYKFLYEVKMTINRPNQLRQDRRSINDYQVDTNPDLNITGEIEYPSQNYNDYGYQDSEQGNIFKDRQ